MCERYADVGWIRRAEDGDRQAIGTMPRSGAEEVKDIPRRNKLVIGSTLDRDNVFNRANLGNGRRGLEAISINGRPRT